MIQRRANIYNRRRQRRNARRARERRFESAIYLLIFGLFAIAYFMPSASPTFIAAAGGVVLIGSALWQTARGWRVNIFTWLGGIALLAVVFFVTQARREMPGGMLLPIGILIGVVAASVIDGNL
ncbi:MAG: hypothetical protein J7551_11405 [Chloroflexi bacterium]|jgi:hypothetical protein|nr:hypothetical protein [Chloroflexota bacterium]